jgi:predicted neutral ceramidase superfamily lipid hydrolase
LSPWPGGYPIAINDHPQAANPPESDADRLDRELEELLQELRVLLPGVQVLFAFLLTLPFTDKFSTISTFERGVYFAAFSATTVSALLLVSPGVRHRTRFRKHDKEAIVRSGTRLSLAGTALLGIAIDAVAFLIADFLYGRTVAIAAASVVFVLIAWFWYGWAVTRHVVKDSPSTTPR